MRLYIATSNPGKLRDFAVAAEREAAGYEIAPLPGLAAMAAPEEDQATFAGNARLKAVFYSRLYSSEIDPGSEALVVADDSGLEVEALNGKPGVHSARYAAMAGARGGGTVDEQNNRHLLASLGSAVTRGAQYRCVLAAARAGVVVASAEGSVAGEILPGPRGSGGFGYDPLFYLPELGCTMAELDPARRLGLSHRGRALAALVAELERQDQLLPYHKDAGALS